MIGNIEVKIHFDGEQHDPELVRLTCHNNIFGEAWANRRRERVYPRKRLMLIPEKK